ncbi:MAG: hypothetical protein ABSA78_00505 [Candidatus Sulfotelmatobacter sp.]|jgi:hypothetical protein
MSSDWEWVSGKEYGWETILVGNDAPYSRRLHAHAHAVTRKTSDNRYFYRFSSVCNEEDPISYANLADCQHDCERGLRIRQVEDKLDGK